MQRTADLRIDSYRPLLPPAILLKEVPLTDHGVEIFTLSERHGEKPLTQVIPPAAKPKAMKAKTVADCKFTKEEDERLACFNGFVENMPKLPKT